MLLGNKLSERNFIEINNSIGTILNDKLKTVKDDLLNGDMKIPVNLKKLMKHAEFLKNKNSNRLNYVIDSCIVENMFSEYKLKFMNERRKVLVKIILFLNFLTYLGE